MQLNEVPAKTGYLWFRQGVWLFRRNPVAFLTTFVAYVFAMMLVSLVPVLGTLVPLLLIPGISVGFMVGCRETVVGKQFFPTVLLSGFRAYGAPVARQLFVLGIAYAIAIGLVFAGSALIDDGALMRVMLFGGMLDEQTLASGNLSLAILVAMALYVPVAMLFWFAPVLVAWHGISPSKAMFFSWVACWRNRGAFVIYGSAWLAVVMMVSFGLTMLLHLLGASAVALPLLMPLSILLTTMLYCSFYATYRGCFEVAEPAIPAPVVKP